MSTLKQRLAQHGFTSNQDYDYPLQCLLSASLQHLRCLNVEGERGRRKTAFAHALAHTLGYDHVLYHEFTLKNDTEIPVRIAPPIDDEHAPGETPVEELDRIISEACALSEGDKTILLLDQLQLAAFKDQLRLTEFIASKQWAYGEAQLKANAQQLLLFLIAEEPLYHSLQQLSFKIWVDSGVQAPQDITPTTLGLPAHAQDMLEALRALFSALNVSPTPDEYKKVIHDIHVNINQIDDLKTSIYGWIEAVDRQHLQSGYMQKLFQTHMPVIRAYLGLDGQEALTPPPENH